MNWTMPYPCRSRSDSVRRISMSSEPGNESFFCALRPIPRILSLKDGVTRIKFKSAHFCCLIGLTECGLNPRRIGQRYKKGRPLWWNQGDREVGFSGGFAPRPPRFNALVPVRKLGKGKTGSVADP